MQHAHDELHTDLDAATHLPGRTGEAARQVVRVLQPHFIREQEYVTPALGLLQQLVADKLSPTMLDVLPLTDRLKTEFPRMREEHRTIVGALQNLADAARAEEQQDVVRFAERVMLQAQMEEEILYPAAILVGEYLRLRFKAEDEHNR
jgi:hypothetical protein